jgi:hypothetical protein
MTTIEKHNNTANLTSIRLNMIGLVGSPPMAPSAQIFSFTIGIFSISSVPVMKKVKQ